MKLTVVHLVESLGLGGMERVIHSFVKGGHSYARVLCVCSGGIVADAMREDGLEVDDLCLGPRGGWAAVLPIYRRLRRLRPFILHTHGAIRAAGRFAGRMAGAKAVVHHMHGTETYGWKQRLFEYAMPADLYLACSEAVRDDFSGQVSKAWVEVVYNPVDVDRYRPDSALRLEGRSKLGVGDDDPVIMTVGRFVPEKGQRFLIEAIPQILARHPGAIFAFIGDGLLKAEAERQAAAVHASVRFLGALEDVLPFLNACDVYIQPSVGREGLGVAVLEAMACGKPAVVSKTQGLSEAIGDCGILVPPADAGSLAEAVNGLLASPDRIHELGEKSKERIMLNFSSEKIQHRLRGLYQMALWHPKHALP